MPSSTRLSRLPFAALAIAIAVTSASWWWLGRAVPMPVGVAPAGGKLECVSYSPFRGAQSPLDGEIRIEPWQIEEDIARLAPLTRCVRTYSTRYGLDVIPAVAERHGLKVLLGLWLSSKRETNALEIEGAIALANRFPQVVTGVVVGNEVLLRGELSAVDLAETIRTVKAKVPVPVTYADVWEFWLRNRDLANVADFITVHILPYWEDEPIAAGEAGAHVESIVRKVKGVFPGRDILVGEVGWPSAGRMREGALPSLSNQALVVQDVLERARRGGFRANIIEATDQPWKRRLEGTVGGHWGLLTDESRTPKFSLGEPVSDHPGWLRCLALGIGVVGAVFGAAWWGAGRDAAAVSAARWGLVALVATVAGVLAGLTAEKIMVETLGWGGVVRSIMSALVALAPPLVGAALIARGGAMPSFTAVLGGPGRRTADLLIAAAGVLLIAVCLVATHAALGLVFDPRYKDFPYPAVTAGVLPLLLVTFSQPERGGSRGAGEIAIATMLALSAGFILINETIANWQAVWLAGSLVALAVTLVRVRDARSS